MLLGPDFPKEALARLGTPHPMSSNKRSERGQEFGASGFPRRLRKESSGGRQEPSPAIEFQWVWKKHLIEKQPRWGSTKVSWDHQ